MNNPRVVRAAAVVVAVMGVGLAIAACDTIPGIRSSASTTPAAAKPSIDEMIAMSMKNMDKVMAMSPEEQKQYVMTTQDKSVQHGKELFHSAKLGTNGFTCATCHPGGATTGGKVPVGKMQMPIPTLVGSATTFPKFKVPNNAVITLPEMNNNCVVMFLKGEPLPLGSQDSRDLSMYVSILSKGTALTPGKQSM